MAKRYAFTATITRLTRLNNSVNANPRYDVEFDNGRTLTTSSDHSFVYGIEGLKGDVQVFVSKANRIVDLRPVTACALSSGDQQAKRRTTTALDAFNLLADSYVTTRKMDMFDGLVELAQNIHGLSYDDAVTYVSEELQEIVASKG